ncbi:MAG: RHS repeat-associated core domain-containing protein [Methylotenera sp.]
MVCPLLFCLVGSPLAATDKVGALKWREHYWPYGERNLRDTKAATETMWFAGKSQDAESKLSYFGARYYDPMLGRFMGIDPVGVDENNVHSHNRYAYGNNNPYKFVDPTGNIAETALDVVSLGLSIAQYKQDPSILNGLGLAYDIVGTAVPILPAGFGIIRSAGKAGAEAAVDVAKGGTYALKDADGIVQRTGRTKDLARREKQHQKEFPELTFGVDKKTDNYAAQRGREHDLYNANPQAKASNGGLNKIKPIRDNNPKKSEYLKAGRE